VLFGFKLATIAIVSSKSLRWRQPSKRLVTQRKIRAGYASSSKQTSASLKGNRASGFPLAADELASKFQRFTSKKAAKLSDSVLPRELFDGTRGYIEKVVSQINGSYDHGWYDCCAVMCRRLAETLIIEGYEEQGRSDEMALLASHVDA